MTRTSAIFAGGQSTRMGKPKEGMLLWDKRPMIDHVIEALRPLSDQIVIVGSCQGYSLPEDPQLKQIPDLHPGHGPLSALEALLASGLDEAYLVVSCDQPVLQSETLTQLIKQDRLSFFRSESGQELDPFPGLYPAWLLPSVEEALSQQHYALRPFLRQHPIHWVPLPDERIVELSNANTPESLLDIERLHLTGVQR